MKIEINLIIFLYLFIYAPIISIIFIWINSICSVMIVEQVDMMREVQLKFKNQKHTSSVCKKILLINIKNN